MPRVPTMPPSVAGQTPLWQKQESVFRFGTKWWDDECAKDTGATYTFLNEINGMSIVPPKALPGDEKRDFSKMKLIKTHIRNRLDKNLNNLMNPCMSHRWKNSTSRN